MSGNTGAGGGKSGGKVVFWIELTTKEGRYCKPTPGSGPVPKGRNKADKDLVADLKKNPKLRITLETVNALFFETAAEAEEFSGLLATHLQKLHAAPVPTTLPKPESASESMILTTPVEAISDPAEEAAIASIPTGPVHDFDVDELIAGVSDKTVSKAGDKTVRETVVAKPAAKALPATSGGKPATAKPSIPAASPDSNISLDALGGDSEVALSAPAKPEAAPAFWIVFVKEGAQAVGKKTKQLSGSQRPATAEDFAMAKAGTFEDNNLFKIGFPAEADYTRFKALFKQGKTKK